MWIECKFPKEALMSEVKFVRIDTSYCTDTCTIEYCPVRQNLMLKQIPDAAPEFTRIQQITEKVGACPLHGRASRWCTARQRYCAYNTHCSVFANLRCDANTETIKKRRIKMQYLVKRGETVELVDEKKVGEPDVKGSVEYELVLEAEYVPVTKLSEGDSAEEPSTPKVSDPVLKKGLTSLMVVTGDTFERVSALSEVADKLKEGKKVYVIKKLWEKQEVIKRKKVAATKKPAARKSRARTTTKS